MVRSIVGVNWNWEGRLEATMKDNCQQGPSLAETAPPSGVLKCYIRG